MPSRKRKNSKLKKVAIEWLKWISAIVPVLIFIYILYYYNQLDFLKKDKQTASVTTVLDEKDSAKLAQVIQKPKFQDDFKVIENEWHLVGGIAIHNLEIENKTARPAKSIDVEFKYLSDTQEALTTKTIIIKKDLPPGKSTKISNVSVGFVNNAAVGCDPKVLTAKY